MEKDEDLGISVFRTNEASSDLCATLVKKPDTPFISDTYMDAQIAKQHDGFNWSHVRTFFSADYLCHIGGKTDMPQSADLAESSTSKVSMWHAAIKLVKAMLCLNTLLANMNTSAELMTNPEENKTLSFETINQITSGFPTLES